MNKFVGQAREEIQNLFEPIWGFVCALILIPGSILLTVGAVGAMISLVCNILAHVVMFQVPHLSVWGFGGIFILFVVSLIVLALVEEHGPLFMWEMLLKHYDPDLRSNRSWWDS